MDVQHGSGLSPWAPREDPPAPEDPRREQRKRALLIGVRYVLPGLIALAGVVVVLTASDHEIGIEIGSMFVGVAIAVFLLNWFFRLGVAGEADRDREEEARAYFDRHGRWPDDPAA
jgi:hypothetical protein